MKFDFSKQEVNQSDSSAMDSQHWEKDFERFELLSAYLDGEVTPSQRQQVQFWLDNDPQFKQEYQELLQLQGSIANLSLTQVEQPYPEFCEQVFQKIDRQSRYRRLMMWGGAAIASVFVGVFSHLSLNHTSPIPQTASSSLPTSEAVNHEPLMVALNKPLVEIPEEAQ